MNESLMEKVAQRFIKYAKQFTTSDPESLTYPSTHRQTVFMEKLVEELKDIGCVEVEMDKYLSLIHISEPTRPY